MFLYRAGRVSTIAKVNRGRLLKSARHFNQKNLGVIMSKMLRIRGVWCVVLFQVFFIIALYIILNSQHSSLQQARVNVNIISVQRSDNSDAIKPLPQNSTKVTYSRLSKDTIATSKISSTIAVTDTSSPLPSAKHRFKTYLLIMVPILPSSFRSREMIRSTWYKGFADGEDVMLRFAMGVKGIDINLTKQLTDENSAHNDLLFFENLKENRSALTNKTLMLMQWAHANVNFTYFLKCDDDTYVFIKRMVNELKKRPTTTRFYYGVIDTKGRPKKANETWPDLEWDISDTYLPYALGGGYILSSDLVSLIAEDSEYLRWHPNEDTAVGSWLAPYKYERRKDKLICIMFFNKKRSKKCPQYHIMHLFFGVKREELEKIFIEYSNLDE